MNVVMLIWSYRPLPEGGAERQCRLLSRHLVARGHACTILTRWTGFGVPRVERIDGVRIIRLGSFAPLMQLAQRMRSLALRRLRAAPSASAEAEAKDENATPVRRFRFMAPFRWSKRFFFLVEAFLLVRWWRIPADVIHIHESRWLAGVGAWLAAQRGIPAVCKEAIYPVLPELDVDVPFRRRWDAWRRRPFFLAMTDAIADGLSREGIPPDRIFRIPNGVEVPPSPAAVMENRDILFVGNFYQGASHKAFDVAIHAWARAWRECPGYRLLMAGSGDPRPWYDLARTLDCRETVCFTGYLKDLSGTFQRTALFIMPSRREGMSNALLEAMSRGIPCVVSDIPGNTTLIRDGVEGTVVPTGDAESLAQAIRRLCADPRLRGQLGSAARKRIVDSFSMNLVAERIDDAYRQMIHTPPS